MEFHPGIKVILTYRNPRDFANSMSQQDWAPDSLSKISKTWNKSMLIIKRLCSEFPEHIKLICYEDMVTKPEKIFEEIYAFTGIEWTAESLKDINSNVSDYVLPVESRWKNNNMQLARVNAGKIVLVLNYKQRLIVHYNNFLTAIRLGLLRNYKF